MTLLEQFKSVYNAYNALLNEHHDQLIKEFIQELSVEYPGLTNAQIVGYTPGFNDGDVCEHNSYIQVRYADEEITDFIDGVPEDFEDNSLSDADGKAIEIKLSMLDEILIHIYGTNYKFGFIIIDGEITVKHEDYDCGY